MKITEVQAVYPRYRHLAPSWRTHFWQIVVRVDTDKGVSGWGYGGGGVAAVEVVNRHFRELLLDQQLENTGDIKRIWEELYRACLPYGRRGIAIMALSGVDLALWDLLGRAENKRVCELLGGPTRERIRAYASGPDVERYRDLGFTATKMFFRHQGNEGEFDQARAWAEKARRVLGSEALLMMDSYMTWDAEFALKMAERLGPYRLYWFEDLLLPDNLEELAALRPLLKPILLAGGEHEFTAYGFAEVARTGALDLWQPDLTWCGGITAGLAIVDLAAQYGIPVVLHRGGEVWGLHLLAAGKGENLAEKVIGLPEAPGDRVWLGEPAPVEGHLELPEGPGFGVALNEEVL